MTHQSLPTIHTIPYDGGESTYIPPDSPHQTASSTTATAPRRSIAKVRCIRRLHMYANRKLRSSELFDPSEPSYTPYHMMAESRPLNFYTSCFSSSGHLLDYSDGTTPIHFNRHVKHSLRSYANRQSDSSTFYGRSGPTFTPYDVGELTSTALQRLLLT